jgi:integration host factor subunit alpha
MTKSDIVEEISRQHGLYRKESVNLVDSVFKLIEEGLEKGEQIKISGFGRFEVKQKAARLARNIHTGEPLVIDARRTLYFKASEQLRSRINDSSL